MTILARVVSNPNNGRSREVWFGLVWFLCFKDLSTIIGYAKAILLEEQKCYYLTHNWGDQGVHAFPKGICLKVNVIARLDFELAYDDSVVQLINHYNTRTHPDHVSPALKTYTDGPSFKVLYRVICVYLNNGWYNYYYYCCGTGYYIPIVITTIVGVRGIISLS